jgi:hypothetical protein
VGMTNDQVITRLEYRRDHDYPLALGSRLPGVRVVGGSDGRAGSFAAGLLFSASVGVLLFAFRRLDGASQAADDRKPEEDRLPDG